MTRRTSDVFEDDPEWHPVRWYAKGVGLIVVVILTVLSLGAMVWGISVAVSGPKGAGDAKKTINSGTNRIEKQELFEQRITDVRSLDQRTTLAWGDYQLAGCKSPTQALPGDEGQVLTTCQKLFSNFTGVRNRCIEVQNNYNADARKVSAEQWRAADLPASLPDPNDIGSTDCKEDSAR